MIDCDFIETDVLVVGSGAAGIHAAIKAHDNGVNVLIINSGIRGKDSAVTWMAGGGFQCAFYPPDGPDVHTRDTIINGRFLSNQELVHAMLKEAPGCIEDLESWGEKFHKKSGRFVQYFLPGHTYARCLQREKEKGVSNFGAEHHSVLPRQIKAKGIPILEDFLAIELLKADGRVVGAAGIDLKRGEFKIIGAKVVILATSGYPACYKHYLTGPSVTGWGHGMAYRVGAEFIDMEFIDCYPYVAVWPRLSMVGDWAAYARYALSGKFFNNMGFEFWESYKKKGLTRPQSIFKEVEAGRGSPHGGVYLSFSHLPANLITNGLKTQHGAKWLKELKSVGFDLKRDAIEVYISAMSTLGGCKIDTQCKTTVPGLYAVGELASGFDGSHTLAGNMMIFCFTSGAVAGINAVDEIRENKGRIMVDEEQVKVLRSKAHAPLERQEGVRPFEIKKRIREIMWKYANVAGRTKEGLEYAIQEIEKIKTEKMPHVYASAKNRVFNLEWSECLELENMVTVSEMTLRAALMRKESRGLHFREDFPRLDPNFTNNIVLSKGEDGISIKTEQVSFPYLKPEEA